MERGLVPRGHLVFCHYERSEVIQKQMLLAMRLLLSLRSIAMTRFVGKNREQVRECHGEESFKTTRLSVKLVNKFLQTKKSKTSC